MKSWMNKIMSELVMEVFVEQTPGLLNRHDWPGLSAGVVKIHKQQTPTLITDEDKITNIKKKKKK